MKLQISFAWTHINCIELEYNKTLVFSLNYEQGVNDVPLDQNAKKKHGKLYE